MAAHDEFKQEEEGDLKKTLSMIADAVVCFANAEGGTLIVGIGDRAKRRTRWLQGVSANLTSDVVRRAVFDQTKPGLSVPVSELVEAGARLIVVTVPQGAVYYANARATATRRLGRDCMPFTPEQQLQAAAARGQVDWSAASSGVGIDGASAEELRRVRRLLALAGREVLASADDVKLLRDLRLLARDGSLTRAGLLLLGREEEIAAAVPSHGYSYQYRSTPAPKPARGSEGVARC